MGFKGVRALLLFMVLLVGCARVQILPSPAAPVSVTPALSEIPIGERLEYQVFWWGVPVGLATLTTADESGKLLKVTLKARSNAYLDAFYPVRVEMASFLEQIPFRPRAFQAYIKRRWKIHQSTVTFDYAERTAFHELPKNKTATVALGASTQDGLSIIYYARTIPFELGKEIPLDITADGKNWPLTGQVIRAQMVRIGKSGTWPAVEGEVQLTYPVPFFHGAKARVWFSADGQRIPLLAKLQSRVGPVTIVLTKRSEASP